MPLDAETLRTFYRQMLLCRRFEEKAAQSYGQEKIHGFCHLYIGQEAVAVGSIGALRPDDYVMATYREHAHALVKGCDPGAVMAELYGKGTGCSQGFGGSMHIFDASKGMFGGHAIVGGHGPLAVGVAFASKYEGNDRVILCYVGDAAVNQGAFHEGLNLASLWKLPVIFIVENNLYGMGTAISRALAGSIVKRGEMYDMPSKVVDGMDIFAVYDATREAVELARKDGTPSFLEIQCYRYRGHSMSDPQNYRTKEEVAREQARDPIEKLKKYMLENGIEQEEWFKQVNKEIRDEVQRAADFADASPEPDDALVDRYVLI